MHNINIHMYVLWSEPRYCCLDKDHTHSRRESRSKNMPQAQTSSACNKQNHYTGCTLAKGEARQKMIDIIEGMMGDSNGTLPGTSPNVSLPYVDMTLQVAPGIPENRPQTGHPPLKEDILTDKGFTEFAAQTWYDDLIFHGNTSINPFFYGTYLGETKKGEPVTRSKKEAFQADAVGAMHQLVPAHFRRMLTFRIDGHYVRVELEVIKRALQCP